MRYIRMKRIFLQGLLWLYLLLEFGYMALSLEPGFLDFDNLPDTNFSCLGKVIGGYYADLETNCQMFHVCTIGQLDEPMDIRFLCLNGTVFDQETRVCERIDEVDCSKSEQFYGLNLELYGNTQPPILEDSPETDQPLPIKSTTTTTSTTTSKPKATNTPFYTSAKPPTITPQTVTSHRFPLGNSPDIRFNPEEINISLHPGAPPDIRTKPAAYQQQSYSDNNKKVVVTTHSENSDNKKVSVTTHSTVFDAGKLLQDEDFLERPRTQKPHSHSFGHANKNYHPTPSDINFEFTFRQTEPSHLDFHTEPPQRFFHSDFRPNQDYAGHHQNQQFKSSTFHGDYTPTTKGFQQQKVPTTIRNNYFLQSLKPPAPNQPHHYNQHQTEKPQRVQLPLPLLPTLSPLTFSTPAPFALQHHIDSKRYTKDHPSPPRIVISASASVSDASGRRLNYSLGTIGAAEFLEEPPHSYDEYKDEDVGLDPFYHDVPKIERSRTKRDATIKHSDIIRNEEEAVNVLKFLFEWYKNNEKTATESTTLPTIDSSPPNTPQTDSTVANTEATEAEITAAASQAGITRESLDQNFSNSELFDENSKFNIIGNVNGGKNQERRNAKEKTKPTTAKTTTTTQMSRYEKDFLDELFGPESDYVNDNFEPIAYKQQYEDKGNNMETVTKPTEVVKNPSLPKDYVDDNIEPIYFSERMHHVTKKVLDESEEFKITKDGTTPKTIGPKLTKEPEKLDTRTSSSQSSVEMKKSATEIGDTETNDIKRNVPMSLFVTSEKPTTHPVIPKRTHRRGRKRYYTTTEKEKELENKHVVLEKITEKAHTAKDDFNYLRTLYKVHATTPIYNVPEMKNLEENGASTTKKVTVIDDFDLKEASPSDKVVRTSLDAGKEGLEEVTPPLPPPYLTPIATTETTTNTTETTTSSERSVPSSITVESTTYPMTILSTTELITSSTSTIATTEKAAPSSTTSKVTVSSSTTTREMMTSSSTTAEIVAPSTTTERRDRRRGRSRYKGEINQSSTRRRRPEETKKSTSKPDNLQPNIIQTNPEASTSASPVEEIHTSNSRSDNSKDIQVEENGSSINRNIVPYTATTEYTPTASSDIRLGGTEKTEFLTQLTLNYKRIFEDISQTAPIAAPVLDVASLAVTEPYRTVSSTSAKAFREPSGFAHKEKGIDHHGNLLLATTTPSSVVEENPQTTSITGIMETGTEPPNQLKSESPILQTEETTSATLLENGGSSDVAFTTPMTTEKPVMDTVIPEATSTQNGDSVPVKVTEAPLTLMSTEKLEEETKPVEVTTEIVTMETTTKAVQKNDVRDPKVEDRTDPTVEPTTLNLRREFYQTTSNLVIPRITEIFTFLKNTRDDIFGIAPTTPLIPAYPAKTTALPMAPTVADRFTSTESYQKATENTEPSTIYVVRTTENGEKLVEDTTKANVDEAQTYPSTVILIRTTEIPKITENEKLYAVHQYSTKTLQRLIEEIEANTKSVVAATDLPMMTLTVPEGTEEVLTTTERRDDLPELTSLFQYSTTPKEDLTESTEAPSSTESLLSKTPSIPATDPDLVSTRQIERLTISERPASTTPITATTTVASRRGSGRRGSRPERRGSSVRHRFSSSTAAFTRRPEAKQTIEDEIINELTKSSKSATTESYRRRLRVRPNGRTRDSSTDAPLQKSASPTQSERAKETLTTPLSKRYFIFNCFGKEVDKFYPDPRDCRLFHYCTQGYSENQLIDMKFVCDSNTYFDDERLICSKRKPRRCL